MTTHWLSLFALLRLGFLSVLDDEAAGLQVQFQEAYLLHQRLPISAYPLSAWPPPPSAPPGRSESSLVLSARVNVLHLWATWCGPCKEPAELRAWSAIRASLKKKPTDQVQLLNIAENDSDSELKKFFASQQDKTVYTPLYLDKDQALTESLRDRLPAGLHLPATLLVDRTGVVRQAFIGPIADRRAELDDAIRRLLEVAPVPPTDCPAGGVTPLPLKLPIPPKLPTQAGKGHKADKGHEADKGHKGGGPA